MDKQLKETMGILQEECAEVIVEISKCFRFGIDSVHYKTGIPRIRMLEQEIGDVLTMIDILIDRKILDEDSLAIARKNKKEKLRIWSNIFNPSEQDPTNHKEIL